MSAPKPVKSVLNTIGNTPVVQLRKLVPEGAADVFVKLEYFNPTGSYKDRMALAMIEGAEQRGTLKPGMRVIEFTGGSTGSSLAMVCAVKGYRFNPVSSDAFAAEKLLTMRAFGADLIVEPSDGGRITPDLFLRMRALTDQMSKQPGTFFTDQFHNDDALNGYGKIGTELIEQLDGKITVYCGAVGTAGMLVGVSRALKAGGCKAKIVAFEPASSAFLTKGESGAHRVEGIATGRRPPHLQDGDFDEARAVEESAAREMAQRLAKEEGILAGTSSGLNVAGAIQIAKELGAGATVVTVAVDTGLKYLAGDLYTA
jgi:cysteine synthase A